MNLGSNIRKIRKERGLRQEQIAEAMGVSVASVSKWETEQSTPELTMLAELADFFEVSVDALMGHKVHGNRLERLLLQIEALENDGDIAEAAELAEKLMHSYPNSVEAIRKITNFYYRAYAATGDQSAIERAIELTKQLLVLEDDPTGIRRFELLSNLGNQYAIIKNWKQARKYYTEGNVGSMNDRALAILLVNEGKIEEAITAVSDIFADDVYNLLTTVLHLSHCWNQLGQPQKADAALKWGVECLELLGGDVFAYLHPLNATFFVKLALSAENRDKCDDANAFIKNAIQTVRDNSNTKGYDFLSCSKSKQLMGTIFDTPQAIYDYLERINANRLCSLIEEELL